MHALAVNYPFLAMYNTVIQHMNCFRVICREVLGDVYCEILLRIYKPNLEFSTNFHDIRKQLYNI